MATTYHHDDRTNEWNSLIDQSNHRLTSVDNENQNKTLKDRESKQQQNQPLSLFEMIQQIPLRIQQRKRFNINAGSLHDPVLQLMKYVISIHFM
jgi:hypothetical protein